MNFSKHILLALSVGALLVAAPITPVEADDCGLPRARYQYSDDRERFPG